MNLKTCVSLIAALVLGSLALPSAEAKPIHAPGRLGLGLGSGTFANGLSAKYFMTGSTALQINLGTSGGSGSKRFEDNGGVAGSGDLLLERGPLLASDLLNLDWSFGLGAGFSFRNDAAAIAAAGVLGLELNFKVLPIDLVLEYRPALAISPDVDLEVVNFSGHLRFYIQ